jgi:hypothetical protein
MLASNAHSSTLGKGSSNAPVVLPPLKMGYLLPVVGAAVVPLLSASYNGGAHNLAEIVRF